MWCCNVRCVDTCTHRAGQDLKKHINVLCMCFPSPIHVMCTSASLRIHVLIFHFASPPPSFPMVSRMLARSSQVVKFHSRAPLPFVCTGLHPMCFPVHHFALTNSPRRQLPYAYAWPSHAISLHLHLEYMYATCVSSISRPHLIKHSMPHAAHAHAVPAHISMSVPISSICYSLSLSTSTSSFSSLSTSARYTTRATTGEDAYAYACARRCSTCTRGSIPHASSREEQR